MIAEYQIHDILDVMQRLINATPEQISDLTDLPLSIVEKRLRTIRGEAEPEINRGTIPATGGGPCPPVPLASSPLPASDDEGRELGDGGER